MNRLALVICLVPALGFQCGKSPPAAPAPSSASEPTPAQSASKAPADGASDEGTVEPLAMERTPPPGTLAVMSMHFDLAQDLKGAVIAGELEAGKASAKDLSESDIAGLPETWRPFLDDMRVAAELAWQADDLESQARAVAGVAQTCGACHLELGAGPGKHLVNLPDQSWPGDDHMPMHLWSTNWMWLGLVAPSQAAFERGASELSQHRILGEKHPSSTLDRAVQQIAADALSQAADEGARVEAMGDLLATCAACHAASGAVLP